MTDPKQPLALHHVLWLLASLAMVTAPHAMRLPWWIVALVVTLGAWRAHLGTARLALPSRWLLLGIVFVATLGIFLHYRTLFGRDAGVTLLVMMMGLKLLEMRTLRDAMLVTLLAYFLVITNFLYSQSIPTALYLLACVWLITATMIGLHHTRVEPPFRRQFQFAGVLIAQSVPLMLILFLLFPRVSGPLWGMPRDAFTGLTGLSDTMSPGSLSDLFLSDAVAFRVRFDSTIPEPRQLYWRGPVMWDFDGTTWIASRFSYGTPKFTANSEAIGYEVTLEPHNKHWIFALDLPGKLVPRTLLSSDFQIRSIVPVTSRIRYEMTSFLDYRYGSDENDLALRRALQLPADSNPRTVRHARDLRNRHADDRALIQSVLAMFRNESFYYTLSPPLLGRHSVDDFLFETRSGFCEYYASAFTVLMRAAGIPARVVTGYQGGELNQLGNYLIVRQADAHAWTEVWLGDEGWVRVDPTAAVSPLRVESGISAAVPRTDSLPLLAGANLAMLRQLRLTWDLLANSWNQWVLGYTPERQRQFLTRVGIDDATWHRLAMIMVGLTGLVVLLLAALVLHRLKARVHDPVRSAYLRFCEKLRRKGIPRSPAEGPMDYAGRLVATRPELAPAVGAITQLYIRLRYGGQSDAGQLREFEQRVNRFTA
jgi:protein-glutamine gamma-glutamyltransferase